MNWIWFLLMGFSLVFGAINGRMGEVTDAAIAGAELAVELAIGLIGVMALWLGIMKIAEATGLVRGLARLLKPILTRLFPDVPGDDPAMGAITMNLAANMFGLGNAATPLGLKAMQELQRVNPHKECASDAMCTFLAINTSSVQLFPVMAVALMAEAESAEPRLWRSPRRALYGGSPFSRSRTQRSRERRRCRHELPDPDAAIDFGLGDPGVVGHDSVGGLGSAGACV